MSRKQALIEAAHGIIDKTSAEGRGLSRDEYAEVQRLTNEARLERAIEDMAKATSTEPTGQGLEGLGSGSLHAAIVGAGFDPREKPTVGLGLGDVGILASVGTPTPATDAAPRRLPRIAELGVDARYLYSRLPTQDIGDDLRVDALVEVTRTLPSPLSSAVLDPTGTATKPEVSSTISLESFDTKMVAVRSGMVPNAIFALPAFATLVDSILGNAFRDSLDAYCYDTIIAAATDAGTTGDDLIEQIRYGIGAVQDNGFSPNLAVVSPSQLVTLDLSRSTTEGLFLLAPEAPRDQASSPLWGVPVVASKSVTDPLVLDTSVLTLYAGNPAFAVNPYSNFNTNESEARLEAPAVLVIARPMGIYVIGTGS